MLTFLLIFVNIENIKMLISKADIAKALKTKNATISMWVKRGKLIEVNGKVDPYNKDNRKWLTEKGYPYDEVVAQVIPKEMNKSEKKGLFLKRVSETMSLNQLVRISYICGLVNVSRATYYEWCNEDAEFKRLVSQKIESQLETVIELVESKVINKALDGDYKFAKLFLDARAKAKGYGRIIERDADELQNEKVAELLLLLGNKTINEFDEHGNPKGENK